MEASSREIVVEAATHGVDGSGGNGVGEGTVAACIGEVDSIAGTGGSEQPVATKKERKKERGSSASLSDVTSSEPAGNGLVSDSESSLPESSVGTCSLRLLGQQSFWQLCQLLS